MKLSFSTLGCPEWSFSDIVSTAKDLGYEGIEIRGVQNVMDVPRIPQFTPHEVDKTKKLLADKKLEIVCLTSACYMNVPDFTQDTVYQAISYVDTARDLGVQFIRVLADFGPEKVQDVDDSLVLKNLKKVADYAACRNVEVLIETNGCYADSKRALGLVEKAGDNVGVIWDIHHPYRFFGESPNQTVGVLGKRLRHVHVKDSKM
ncbi:MAG: sugar phosphate isomerase/epimerase family protein [Eubacteriales bacterium]